MIGNLLSLAQGVIGVQPVAWERMTGRTENAAGYQVATYAAAVTLRASVQPVPQKMFDLLGLDRNREYINVYTPGGVVAVGRDESGDRLTYAGRVYVAESETPWLPQAGWSQVLAVRVA